MLHALNAIRLKNTTANLAHEQSVGYKKKPVGNTIAGTYGSCQFCIIDGVHDLCVTEMNNMLPDSPFTFVDDRCPLHVHKGGASVPFCCVPICNFLKNSSSQALE